MLWKFGLRGIWGLIESHAKHDGPATPLPLEWARRPEGANLPNRSERGELPCKHRAEMLAQELLRVCTFLCSSNVPIGLDVFVEIPRRFCRMVNLLHLFMNETFSII